ncbi:hypothetical protein Hdeb2414_s0015g00448611 [Helianthus debilis subsp. tardiflorus]
MEDLKKKFKDDLDTKTEPQGKASDVCDENLTLKDDPKGKTIVDVDENLTLKVDPTGKTNVLFSEPSLPSIVVLIPFGNIQLMLVKVFCR